MASSEPRAAVNLEFLVGILDPARLRRRIDAPIEAVTESFLARKRHVRTWIDFNRLLIRFVRQIYAHGRGFARILPSAEAFGIALQMLNRVYDPAAGQGYELALLAVVREKREPIESVLRAIAEAIKEDERDQYRNWVYARYVGCLSWTEKCALAADVIHAQGADADATPFPPNPSCLAGRVTELIDAHIAAVTAAQDITRTTITQPATC